MHPQSVLPTYRVVHVQNLLWEITSWHCLEYGVCGIGSYCLGGCDPRYSFQIDSCMPAPQCVNKTYTFENISTSFADYSTYLGNQSTGAEWTYSGYPLQYGSNALLTMPANSAGTVIMSTNYVWYAKVSATMKTARDQGVVTAFMYAPLKLPFFF